MRKLIVMVCARKKSLANLAHVRNFYYLCRLKACNIHLIYL